MENRKENKMGVMPVPKLVITMSLPIMIFGLLGMPAMGITGKGLKIIIGIV